MVSPAGADRLRRAPRRGQCRVWIHIWAREYQRAEEPLGELFAAGQPQLQRAPAARAAARAGLRCGPRALPSQGDESFRALLAAGGPRVPGLRRPPALVAAAWAYAAALACWDDAVTKRFM